MPKLFVATPCYGGQVHNGYFKSMLELVKLMDTEVFTIPFESLIPRARNVCASAFMKSDCTHMIFIDADITFNPKDINGMIECNKDVIAGVYPKKSLKLDMIKKHSENASNLSSLIAKSVGYAFNAKKGKIAPPGIIEVMDAPTGFLLIKRSVIVKLMVAYSDRKYKNDIQAYEAYSKDGYFYDLFPSFVDIDTKNEKRFLSEDYGFCRLWQKLEGEIFADLRVNLNHTGQFTYIGCPIAHLNST